MQSVPTQSVGTRKIHEIRQLFAKRYALAVFLGFAMMFQTQTTWSDDLIEFLNGAKVRGTVVSKSDSHVSFKANISGRIYTRKYPLEKIHAVTIERKNYKKRHVINEKSAETTSSPKNTATSPQKKTTTPESKTKSASSGQTTREDIEAIIEKVGRQPPDWWKSVPLDYPRSLDLSWPIPPPKGWNNQKNVGQYIWDIINHNPNRWRSGVRFMHHMYFVNKNRPKVQLRVLNELGRMYHDLLEDYPRAAFWWSMASVDKGNNFGRSGVHLAECYWRMGSKEMAVELLEKLPPHFSIIKLWADMGETRKALQLADAYARGSNRPDIAYMHAGDACRLKQQYPKAMSYYQKVLDLKAPGNKPKMFNQSKNRARASIEGIRLFELLDVKRIRNSTYDGKSPGYAGDIFVRVVVNRGRILSVKVIQHKEKQFYSAFSDTRKKIIAKQGVKGIDTTSSATITSEAIINATAKALSRGAR